MKPNWARYINLRNKKLWFSGKRKLERERESVCDFGLEVREWVSWCGRCDLGHRVFFGTFTGGGVGLGFSEALERRYATNLNQDLVIYCTMRDIIMMFSRFVFMCWWTSFLLNWGIMVGIKWSHILMELS